MNPQRFLILFASLALIALAGCQADPEVACTADAKICPDGSAVGRVPPTCEFAACPEPRDASPAVVLSDRDYRSEDPEMCMAMRFTCDGGEQHFADGTGCGCEPEGSVRSYVATDVTVCAATTWVCGEGQQQFFGETGCGCEPAEVFCTMDVKVCPDGSEVGRVAPSCEFAACPGPEARTYVSADPAECTTLLFQCVEGREPFFDDTGCGCQLTRDEPTGATLCAATQREAGACTEQYDPVCGWFDPDRIQCIRYPCAQTFSNTCFACDNPDVLEWTPGECPA